MKTGRDADRSSLYISDCCLREITVVKGEMLPRCPRCYGLTLWELVKQEQRARALIRKGISSWIAKSTNLFPKEFQGFPRGLASEITK